MPAEAFRTVSAWVFDLDNTLYPADCHLFKQIDARMASFIEQELALPSDKARFVQKDYYVRYGTTLSGLMKEHDVCPRSFMDYVHDIDLSVITEDNALRVAINQLPGEKYIFTNGSMGHAERVASALGIWDLFDDAFDVAQADYCPKPHAPAYDAFLERFGITPVEAAMFEDMPQNLIVPHERGMRTVLVQSDAEWLHDEPEEKRPARPGQDYDHVHHVTDDLTRFLRSLTPANQTAD